MCGVDELTHEISLTCDACREMAHAVTTPGPGYTRTWPVNDVPSCLPKGLHRLVLPETSLPDEIVEEINNLAELKHLECMASNGYWPSQDLIGLKVRSRCRCCCPAADAVGGTRQDRDIQICTPLKRKCRLWHCLQ